MTVQEDANFSFRAFIEVSRGRKPHENLCFLVDAVNDSGCCSEIIRSNVVVNVFQPTLCFACPVYSCHERMRRCISSFEIVRPAWASAKPRCTMIWNASSLTICSGELSSGWLSINFVSSSFAVDTISPSDVSILPLTGKTGAKEHNAHKSGRRYGGPALAQQGRTSCAG